jgi:hypothetical protein
MTARFERLTPETRNYLRQRYGVDRFGPERSRGRIIIALVISIIALPWLLQTAWRYSNPEFSISPVKYQTLDDSNISLTFDLIRRNPDTPTICTLIALDIDRNIVGEIDLKVPGGDARVERITSTIPTRLRAVNASASRCVREIDATGKIHK